MRAKIITPPNVPPTIAPIGVFLGGVGDVDDVGGGMVGGGSRRVFNIGSPHSLSNGILSDCNEETSFGCIYFVSVLNSGTHYLLLPFSSTLRLGMLFGALQSHDLSQTVSSSIYHKVPWGLDAVRVDILPELPYDCPLHGKYEPV